ncbi:MAG: hypothetical protein GY906_08365 [bacterium]|nr:hypothetical protein [bacterium]
MKWVSAISEADDLRCAVEEVREATHVALDSYPADLVLAFVSATHRQTWDVLPKLLHEAFPAAEIVGCSGGGTIGSGQEVEDRPSLALMSATLPDISVRRFVADPRELSDRYAETDFWEERTGVTSLDTATMIIFPDPFSCDAESLVHGLNAAYPRATVVGGLASGGQQAGDNVLISGGEARSSGVVGLALSGSFAVDTIVAQGCRPIGNPMFVTSCDGHLLFEIDGQRPTEVLNELFTSLPERDQDLLRYSLFLGLVMEEGCTQYNHGDFLVRNVLGLDSDTNALIVGAELRQGQVIQFHLRDEQTSRDDLQQMLDSYSASHSTPPDGAVLFSCLGRGKHLYGISNHDSTALLNAVGKIPLAGFFCNGEIGPVQGVSFVHGYTSVVALFRSL